MSVKEIVTLQIGHFSNFVGTHLWNIQESSFIYDPASASEKEVNHDVLYREGQNQRRQITFTPRLVASDLKGSLKTLKQQGELYDTGTEGEEILWPGDVTMHTEEAAGKNAFLMGLDGGWSQTGSSDRHIKNENDDDDDDKDDIEALKEKKKSEHHTQVKPSPVLGKHLNSFDDQVTVWSDFLGSHFHPKSVHVVEEYKHQDELSAFDLFPLGESVLKNYETNCDWEDRLHFFTEECDNLQGFHVLMDTHDGFGGLGTGLLKYIEDEFPGKGVLTFGFTPSGLPDDTPAARATRIINSALSYEAASSHSSLFVPASLAKGLWRVLEGPHMFPSLNYKSIPYHTSAILASAIDTMSLPYRLDTGAINLRDITHSFNLQGRKLGALNTSLPLSIFQDESLIDFLAQYTDDLNSCPWQTLTPHLKGVNPPFAQSVVLRGIKPSQVPSTSDLQKLPHFLAGLTNREEVMRNFLGEKFAGSPFAVNCLNSPMKTSIPFPHIFSDKLTKTGYVSRAKRPDDCGVESVPMMTSLQSTPELGTLIDSLYQAASKINMKKHHKYLACGMEEDDYAETLSSLMALRQCYSAHNEAI
ncbi:protein misato homolog 1-like isoform X2 [Mya arenaria]|uniref:protein misato homolog 1-like isoform X2 n=1 Tax=Mya arenaria TaxID=6604 RepID=UPI0022E029FF|nr:protein misato homolog 1-like isoform X2 [Mya arenaria]